jgi:antimicrobial peptide system SdpA family protein
MSRRNRNRAGRPDRADPAGGPGRPGLPRPTSATSVKAPASPLDVPPRKLADRRHRRLGLRTVVLVTLCVLVGGYTAHTALPRQASGLPFDRQLDTVAAWFLPQGWAFFAKSPQSPFYAPFHESGDGWTDASTGPLAKPSNAFGFDRAVRLQNVEISGLLAGVPDNRWVACPPGTALAAAASCISRAAPPSGVVNADPRPSLCGPIAIVNAHAAPWATAGTQPVQVAQSVLRIDVQC